MTTHLNTLAALAAKALTKPQRTALLGYSRHSLSGHTRSDEVLERQGLIEVSGEPTVAGHLIADLALADKRNGYHIVTVASRMVRDTEASDYLARLAWVTAALEAGDARTVQVVQRHADSWWGGTRSDEVRRGRVVRLLAQCADRLEWLLATTLPAGLHPQA